MSKEILYKNMIATVVKSDDNKATIKAVFSTDTEDRHGESVKQKFDLRNFRKNPVILNSHNSWDATEVVGMASKIGISKGNLAGEITFAVEENPKAKIIYQLYKGGFLNAFSIGFIPKEFSSDYKSILSSELLEISCVSVPANGEALQVAKSKGIDVEKLSPFYKFTDPKEIEDDIDINEEDEVVDEIVEKEPETVEKPKKKPKNEVVEDDLTEEKEEKDKVVEEEEKTAEINAEPLKTGIEEDDVEEETEETEEDKERAKEQALKDIKEDETASVNENEEETDDIEEVEEDKEENKEEEVKEDSKSLLSRVIKQLGEEAKAKKVVTLERQKAEEVRAKRVAMVNKAIRELLKIKKL
jgi:HK97 family phage prohead protease